MNKLSIINELVLISNSFDNRGLYSEADHLDKIIIKYAFEEGLISEAGWIGDTAEVVGRGVGKAIEVGIDVTKKLVWNTWDKVLKPAGAEIFKTTKSNPLGVLLIATLANAAGSAGVTPFSLPEFPSFIEEDYNLKELTERTLYLASEKYEYKDYTVKSGDSIKGIVKSNYEEGHRELAESIIIEKNKLENPNLISVGQVLEIPKNLETALNDSLKEAGETIEVRVMNLNPRDQARYDDTNERINSAEANSKFSSDLEDFKENWRENGTRYEHVSTQTGIPAKLIAALHWREAVPSGDFGAYLHNGQPLGKKTTIEPKGLLFYSWEEAAVHALTSNRSRSKLKEKLGIHKDTDDNAALSMWAEAYNGLGYRRRGLASPYIFSGTNQYSKGKYTSDGRYNPEKVDKQPGVYLLMKTLDEID